MKYDHRVTQVIFAFTTYILKLICRQKAKTTCEDLHFIVIRLFNTTLKSFCLILYSPRLLNKDIHTLFFNWIFINYGIQFNFSGYDISNPLVFTIDYHSKQKKEGRKTSDNCIDFK